MKRFFIIFLLTAFSSLNIVYAGETIIVDPNGYARYENESIINTNYNDVDSVYNNTRKSKDYKSINIMTSSGTMRSIYYDEKGTIKNIGKTKEIQSTPISKNLKSDKYSDRVLNSDKILYNANSIIKQYNYGINDSSSNYQYEYVKATLLDGDYIIAHKNCPYYAEYHPDGKIMGLVKSQLLSKNDSKILYAFYEYRGSSDSNDSMQLKHVLFIENDKSDNISQYIYNADGELLCSQENNNIYVAKNARNMLSGLSKNKNMYEMFNKQNKIVVYNNKNAQSYNKNNESNSSGIFGYSPIEFASNMALVPVALPVAILSAPILLVGALAGVGTVAIWYAVAKLST